MLPSGGRTFWRPRWDPTRCLQGRASRDCEAHGRLQSRGVGDPKALGRDLEGGQCESEVVEGEPAARVEWNPLGLEPCALKGSAPGVAPDADGALGVDHTMPGDIGIAETGQGPSDMAGHARGAEGGGDVSIGGDPPGRDLADHGIDPLMEPGCDDALGHGARYGAGAREAN